eukprot:365344-Chlamydomonas_euryale.AAC.16
MPPAASEDAGPVQMRLLVILGSHYCERARWALDLAGLAYEQDVYPPVVHMPGTRSARPRDSASTSVPMLLTPDEGVLTDSGDIVRYAWTHAGSSATAQALYPADLEARAEVAAVEKEATRLGVWVRVVLYHYMFKNAPREAIIDTLCQVGTRARLSPSKTTQPCWLSAEAGMAFVMHMHACATVTGCRCMLQMHTAYARLPM